jgi:hypothetical protein
MLINIEQQDIDSGEKRSVANCAIAKAFKRIYNNEHLDVCVTTCGLSLNGKNYHFEPYVTQFIHDFDSSITEVKPIQIDIPTLCLV